MVEHPIVGHGAVVSQDQDPEALEPVGALGDHQMAGVRVDVVDPYVGTMCEEVGPAGTVGLLGGRHHHLEVERPVGIRDHEQPVAGRPAMVVDVVLVVLGARFDDPRWLLRVDGGNEPDLGRGLRRRRDHDVFVASGPSDRHVEVLVGLLEHEYVFACVASEEVTPHLPGAHGGVGPDVEEGAVVARPRDAVVHILDAIGERFGLLHRADLEQVTLGAGDVGAEREQRVVGAHREVTDREVVVPRREGVLVEDHVFVDAGAGCREGIGQPGSAGGATTVDGVLAAFDRAGVVLVGSQATRG